MITPHIRQGLTLREIARILNAQGKKTFEVKYASGKARGDGSATAGGRATGGCASYREQPAVAWAVDGGLLLFIRAREVVGGAPITASYLYKAHSQRRGGGAQGWAGLGAPWWTREAGLASAVPVLSTGFFLVRRAHAEGAATP